MEKGGCVYFMTNKNNTVLYVGSTVDLIRRVTEHKEKFYANSFTAKYNCLKLVYYMGFHNIEEARAEEQRIKGGSRAKKISLINSINEGWMDLWDVIKEW